MVHFSPNQIRNILETGEFDQLVGAVEHEQMDAKSEPYRLGDLRGKLELAKDVAGFANATGGVIVIGARTEKSPVHFGDEIREIRPFDRRLIDIEQHHAVIGGWVYPRPDGVEVQWFAGVADPTRGIVGIVIPEQSASLKPFLVAHTVDESGRQIDIVFGYTERRRAGIEPLRIHDLQALLKAGRQQSGVNDRLDVLAEEQRRIRELLMEERPGETQTVSESVITHEELHRRRLNALEALGFEEVEPWFSFSVLPASRVELPTLFAGDNSGLVRALNHPPRLRAGGFDLTTGGSAEIVAGRLRRSLAVGTKIFDVHRDGVLIFIADGKGFLCYGTLPRSGVPLRLNSLALCETAYAFGRLSQVVYREARPAPQHLTFNVTFQGMRNGGRPAQMLPGPTRPDSWLLPFPHEIHEAPDDGMEREVPWEGGDLHPGVVAHRLVREVYRWFGMNDEDVPYTIVLEMGERAIDPEAIVRGGQG